MASAVEHEPGKVRCWAYAGKYSATKAAMQDNYELQDLTSQSDTWAMRGSIAVGSKLI